jgi:hypothetical protein
MIPWISSRPRIASTAGLPIADEPADAGVDYDLRITLFGSPSRGARSPIASVVAISWSCSLATSTCRPECLPVRTPLGRRDVF